MAKARQSARGLPGARRSCQLATPRRCHRGSTGRALAGRGGRAAHSAPARVCLGSANSLAEARACHTRAKKERAHRSRAVLERARTRGRAQRWLRAHSPAPSPRSSARPFGARTAPHDWQIRATRAARACEVWRARTRRRYPPPSRAQPACTRSHCARAATAPRGGPARRGARARPSDVAQAPPRATSPVAAPGGGQGGG